MNWLDLFKTKEVVGAPVMYESVAFDAKGLRTGSWVMTEEGVGILTAEGVALTDGEGFNKMAIVDGKAVVAMVHTVMRQAYLEEIPASRRPDSLMNEMLGYKEAP